MPIIQDTTSVAANATVDNVFSGSVFEYLPFNAMLELAVQMAAGETDGDVVATFYNGSDVVFEEMPLSTKGPIKQNEDVLVEDAALAGDRLVLRLRNTTGVPTVVHTFLRLTSA